MNKFSVKHCNKEDTTCRFVTWFPKGIRVHKPDIYRTANSLIWEKSDGEYWIARADAYETVMLKDIE